MLSQSAPNELSTREGHRDAVHRRRAVVKNCGARPPDYRYDPYFVEVQLAGANDRQARLFGTRRGGLWLMTQGIEAVGLASATVKLPRDISADPVTSLNHAYTKLSELFETWRISHTGNIYKRILYREKNEKWYPLDVLRNRALQNAEHETAQALWNTFMARMTNARQRPDRT